MHKLSMLSHNWLVLKSNNETLRNTLGEIRGTVYDLGCGVRPYEQEILQVADEYIGVDWSNSLHDLKAEIVTDLNKPLPIENAVADTVVSFQVLEHLREPQAMLREAHRILKPGGAIFVTVPWQWRIHEAPHDYFRYTPYGLKYLFEQAGFVDIEIKAQAGFFSMLTLKMNYFSLRLIRGPRPLRWVLRAIFNIIWLLDQILAPIVDKLDRNWELEASGYSLIAYKKGINPQERFIEE